MMTKRTKIAGLVMLSVLLVVAICVAPSVFASEVPVLSEVAVAKEYDAENGRALFIQRNKFCVGDAVELISPGKLGRGFDAGRMTDTDGAEIPSVPHPFMEFWLDVPFEVKPGDILRGANR